MTSEKRAKNMLENMPTKQKITIAVTAIVVLIVLWQVIGLFRGSSPASTPTITPAPAQMSAQAPGKPEMPTGGGAQAPASGGGIAAMPSNPSATSTTNMPREVALTKDQFLEEQQKIEKKYLKQVNDLEQLKIERQIQETNQAIATAKLATVTAEKSTADLLTKPTPVVPDTAYASQLVNPIRSGTTVMGGEQAEAPKEEVVVPAVSYSVISVSQQLNRWTAVLGAQGKLFTVSIGDILPLDGSEVISINRNGVVLKKEKKTTRISMVTAI
jgi:hypothetical protein